MRGRRKDFRRQAVGAEFALGRGVHFRVWCPGRERVEAILEDARGRATASVALEREKNGYFSGWAPRARAGTLYRYRLDGEGPYPDPASRFQPRGPHGPSQVIDPDAFPWTDASWRGPRPGEEALYELHVGTFTREGTWRAAAGRLSELADVGITVLEVMPVADFPGRFGWGYDGCDLFAPTRLYGTPDDFRAFVDQAHALGLGVILDVVYNHVGPDGNFLTRFSPHYFVGGAATDWGEALNFDGPGSGAVREFYAGNAAYWIREFHLDGLRLDATQAIRDRSREHVIATVARAARVAAGRRRLLIIAENESQEAILARPASSGGFGLDALWNDDFHHTALVALTGRREAYYDGYLGSAQELVSCLLRGFLYQGQFYDWQGRCRGTPAGDLGPASFVHYLENHDQIANSLDGRRLHQLVEPAKHRALTALLLLGPQTPLLFQGQEFGSSRPFAYFADHVGALGVAVRDGRREFLAQFPSLRPAASAATVPDPGALSTFERCKLDHEERARNAGALALHRDLLALRRDDPAFRARRGVLGATLGKSALALRFPGVGGGDRLLILNLGVQRALTPASEPLLAPPERGRWEPLWSSENVAYGGGGIVSPVDERGRWRLPASSATLLGRERS